MIINQEEAYWSQYYKAGVAPEEPSLFAQHVMENHVHEGQTLVELGCGNGRDARFFAANGVEVVAVDQVASEIDVLAEENSAVSNLSFVADDFTDMPDRDEPVDVVYSRFTLHSVTAEGQESALNWAHRNLAEGGRLCVETRGQQNELYQKGEPVEGQEDAFIYEDHYRRFVDFEDFTRQIKSIGFTILEAVEDKGFAPYQGTDYQFIRVVAEK